MKNKKSLLVSIAIVIVAVLAFTVYNTSIKNRQVEGLKEISVTVIDESNGVNKTFEHKTEALMLGEALDEMNIIGTDDSEFGRFVHTVDGIYADMDKTEWWKFEINGQDSQTGVDGTPINDGDEITFIFTIGW